MIEGVAMTPERCDAWRREFGQAGIDVLAFDDFGPCDVDVFGFERDSSRIIFREWLERRFDGDAEFSITSRSTRSSEVAQAIRDVYAESGRERRWNYQVKNRGSPVYGGVPPRVLGHLKGGVSFRFWIDAWERGERERLSVEIASLDLDRLELEELRALVAAIPERVRR